MAEGQGAVGLWAGEKSPGWSGKLPARGRRQAAWIMQRIWMGRDMRGWRVWSRLPKGYVWNWGKRIHVPGGNR